MPLVRQLIAIVLLLAMIGGARACLLIEHHVAGAKSASECQDHAEPDEDSCVGCSSPASLSVTELRLPLAPDLSFEAIEQTISVLLGSTALPQPAAEAPPDDPPSAHRWFERMARAWPARGPNC